MKPKPKKQKTQIEQSRTQTDFSLTITKTAVSQICQSLGFKGTQFAALETLTLITTKYLQTLAKSAASFCNASNRTQSNLLDLINALHDLSSSVQGFPGSSTLDNSNSCLLESSVLKGIFSFVDSTDEIPFAKPIPRKALISQREFEFNSNSNSNSPGMHIPNWLPEFPDESTYNDKKRRNDEGEKLWEESMVKKCGDFEENEDCGKKKGNNGDLAVERGRVRFKIGGIDEGGVKVRNGMCRGGKRVCWNGSNNSKSDGGVGENHEKRSGLKRKR